MVDSRSLNAVSPTSAFSFKSGDISGTAAKMSDEKMGQGSEYFQTGGAEQQVVPQIEPYIDRSSQLRATLNSLAIMNVANILKSKKIKQTEENDEQNISDEIDEQFKDVQSDVDVSIDELLKDDEELEQT